MNNKANIFLLFFSIIIISFIGCSKNKSSDIKQFKIGILDYVDSLYTEEAERGIIDGLKENALTNNAIIDVKNAQGDMATLNMAADMFAQGDYDLIFAVTPPAMQVAMKKIKNKPIVFTNAGNPIEAGVGKSFEDHLPNITGINTIGDFEGALKIIKNFYPDIKKIGTLFTPAELDSNLYLKKFTAIANEHNIEVIAVPVTTITDIPDAANTLCGKNIDVICQIIDNLTGSAFIGISNAAKKNKIPLFCFGSQNVKKEFALAAASRDYYDCGKEAVEIGIKILNGENPAKIPIKTAQKTKIVLNKKLAEFYNIRLTDENTKIFTEIY